MLFSLVYNIAELRRPLAFFKFTTLLSLLTDHGIRNTVRDSHNSFPAISFTDPHPLTLFKSYRFKNRVGRLRSAAHGWSYHVTGTLPRLISFACHSYENTGGVGVFFPFWHLPTCGRFDDPPMWTSSGHALSHLRPGQRPVAIAHYSGKPFTCNTYRYPPLTVAK